MLYATLTGLSGDTWHQIDATTSQTKTDGSPVSKLHVLTGTYNPWSPFISLGTEIDATNSAGAEFIYVEAGTHANGWEKAGNTPYYIFVRSSTDTETVNPAPEYKTLTFEYKPNDLIFTFREDESPYSWQEAYDEAIANGKRMPTKTELLNYLSSLGYTLQSGDTKTPLYNEDMWIAVVAPEYSNGRDYISIGEHPHSTVWVGQSHTEHFGYPSWATESTDALKKQYCEVIEETQTEYTVNFTEETECDILIVGGGGGGGSSDSSASAVPGWWWRCGWCGNISTKIFNRFYTIKVGKGGDGDNR